MTFACEMAKLLRLGDLDGARLLFDQEYCRSDEAAKGRAVADRMIRERDGVLSALPELAEGERGDAPRLIRSVSEAYSLLPSRKSKKRSKAA